jgi:hypothetical protein
MAASIAAFLVFMAGPAIAEKWVQIGREQTGGTSGRVYWDTDSLVLDAGRLRLRSRIVFDRPTVPQQYGSPVKSIRSDFDISCARFTGRHLLSEMYDTEGKVVFTLRGARGDTLVPAPVVLDVCDEAKERAS